MKKIIVVGGAGYIGSRLVESLASEDHLAGRVDVVDLGVFPDLARRTLRPRDVRDLPDKYFDDALVVWLASFHREPDSVSDMPAWSLAYGQLMVDEAIRAAKRACHTIYVSSMRAVTRDSSLYAATKREAELVLTEHGRTSFIRPGTVWGDLRPGWPNRTNTAVNFALTRRKFLGTHWSAFTTHMSMLLTFLQYRIESLIEETDPRQSIVGQVDNVTDTPTPMTADDIRALLAGTHACRNLRGRFSHELKLTPGGLDFGAEARAARNLEAMFSISCEGKRVGE